MLANAVPSVNVSPTMAIHKYLKILRSLEERHETNLGVSWRVSPDPSNEGAVYFYSFRRYPGAKKGNGKIAMAQIIKAADRLGITITLWTIVDKLRPYYESFGFQEQVNCPHYAHAAFYIRHPIAG